MSVSVDLEKPYIKLNVDLVSEIEYRNMGYYCTKCGEFKKSKLVKGILSNGERFPARCLCNLKTNVHPWGLYKQRLLIAQDNWRHLCELKTEFVKDAIKRQKRNDGIADQLKTQGSHGKN